jgi:hypothetical protein
MSGPSGDRSRRRREASATARQIGASSARRAGSGSVRILRVWRQLPHERRLAAAAALALFISLFLPWYQFTVIANGVSSLRSASGSLTGWGAFSFVEAAVLLVAVSVLFLLFIRAEGGAFHVPGGDGGVITAAGVWTCVLIIWRMFDKEGTTGHGQFATTSGIEWGIFVALGIAGLLTYAGTRIRLAHEPEPPLPGEPPRGTAADPGAVAAARDARRARRREVDLDDTWAHLSPRASATEAGAGAGAEAEAGAGARASAPSAGAPALPASAPAVSAGPAHAVAAAGAAEASPKRARPRSIAAGAEPSAEPTVRRRPERSEHPTRVVPADPAEEPTVRRVTDPTEEPTVRRAVDPGATPRRPLDRREIAELELADPPTAPLKRSAPPPRPQIGGDDPVTLRDDRPR